MKLSKYYYSHPDLGFGVDVNAMAKEADEFRCKFQALKKLWLEASEKERYYKEQKEHWIKELDALFKGQET